MDLDKMLKNVSNLNDYISITQEIVNYTHNNTKIQFNMSSVLLLKKVRSLEIEVSFSYYFLDAKTSVLIVLLCLTACLVS